MTVVFTNPTHFQPGNRSELIDILKPYIGKPDNFTSEQRTVQYGFREDLITFSKDMSGAELAILPMSWNYYLKTGRQQQALEFIQTAQQAGKQILSWTSGDFGVRIPKIPGLIVLRCSGYASKADPAHRGMAVLIRDPLKQYFHTDQPEIRSKQAQPVVGFCGQASGTFLKYVKDVFRTAFRNIRYYAGLSPEEPQTIYPSTLLRSRALRYIEQRAGIQSNFIKRTKYRAGVVTEDERHQTTLEFFNNIRESDYVVCLRGGGNFSVRLYETMAMGRIPIIVDTDCLLPLPEVIDWGKQALLFRDPDLQKLPAALLNFHKSLTSDQFKALQQGNRLIWEKHLSFAGFNQTLLQLIKQLPA